MDGTMADIRSYLSRISRPFLIVLAAGLIIRFVLFPLTFNADPYYWSIFTSLINGNNGLYDASGYTYTPIWGYFLSIVSFLGSLFGISHFSSVVPMFIPYTNHESTFEFITTIEFNSMLKFSLVVVDVIVAFLIFYLLDEVLKDKVKAAIGSAIWFLCPIVIMESSIHGMFDNISALFLVLSLIFLYKQKYLFGGFVFAFAVLTKFFPIFFIFIIVAMILKREGLDRRGLNKIGTAVAGFAIGFVLIYLPIFATGTFWNSLSFLTNRLGINIETLNSVLPAPVFFAMAIGAIAVVSIAAYLLRNKIKAKLEAFRNMDPKTRDRRVMIVCIAAIAVLFVAIGSLMLGTILTGGTDLASKGTVFLFLASIIIQIFIAYRYLFVSDLSLKSAATALMLTGCTMFLLPPTPQYVVVIVPLLAFYAMTADKGFVRPVMIFGTAMMLNQLALGNISILYSLGTYTSLISETTLKSLVDLFLVSSADVMRIIRIVVGPIAYLTIINMIFYWLKRNRWGKLNEQ